MDPSNPQLPNCGSEAATVSATSPGTEHDQTSRRRCWDEAFASDSEEDCCTVESSYQEKTVNTMEESEISSSSTGGVEPVVDDKQIICEAHPSCMKTFSSIREYEDHYQLRHMHKCVTCRKSLPSSHILELHVLEAHDTLFSLMAEKKPMLACFLETCSTKFWKAEERKNHCLTEHNFPKTFYLWNLESGKGQDKKTGKGGKKGKDKQKDKSTLKSTQRFDHHQVSSSPDRVSSSVSQDVMEVESETSSEATTLTAKSNSKGKPKGAPVQITFGHSAPRTFKVKYTFGLSKDSGGSRSTPESNMELDMSDIKEMLPSTAISSETTSGSK